MGGRHCKLAGERVGSATGRRTLTVSSVKRPGLLAVVAGDRGNIVGKRPVRCRGRPVAV